MDEDRVVGTINRGAFMAMGQTRPGPPLVQFAGVSWAHDEVPLPGQQRITEQRESSP